MKTNGISGILGMGLTVLVMSGCVSSKQYKDLESSYIKTAKQRDSLSVANNQLTGQLADADTELDFLRKAVSQLKEDTTQTGQQLRYLKGKNQELADLNETLDASYRKLMSGSEQETGRILTELRDAQTKLQTREDELMKLQASLEEKSKRLQDLEKALEEKDADVRRLKDQVLEALKGFKDSGLTVEIKNGKVYVSMSEKLLFASGSTEVDQKGKDALKELAKVIEKNKEINIMIEGHTDNVPLKGTGCLKDNWDLSVARATAIVKIILASGSIDPSRLTASGRGEYVPVAGNDTPDNRARNRRTEIILTPKLDKLFDILQ